MVTKEMEKKMRILVTGDAGYIGTELTSYLTSLGHEVEGCDKVNGKYVENRLSVFTCDAVVHLAGLAGVKDCEDNREQAYLDNIVSSTHIFNLAHKDKKPVVFASTQAAKKPDSHFYAMTKYIAEQEALRLNSLGAELRVLRFTNVYGGDMSSKNSVVAKYRRACDRGEPLIVNGNGIQVRDFIHISDVCRAIYKAIGVRVTKPIDIGTGVPTKIKDLAEMFGCRFTILPDYDKVGIIYNVADTKDAKEILGFEADVKLKDWIG